MNPVMDQLEQDAARLHAVTGFLSSPMLVAQLRESLETAVVRMSSPWLNRKDAAEYARCSVSEIDRASAAGFIQAYPRGGTPMFLKAEMDEAIRSGKWKKAGTGTRLKASSVAKAMEDRKG